MPKKELDFTTEQETHLDAVAAKRGKTTEEYLADRVNREVTAERRRKYSGWFDGLPLDEAQRIYDAEHA